MSPFSLIDRSQFEGAPYTTIRRNRPGVENAPDIAPNDRMTAFLVQYAGTLALTGVVLVGTLVMLGTLTTSFGLSG